MTGSSRWISRILKSVTDGLSTSRLCWGIRILRSSVQQFNFAAIQIIARGDDLEFPGLNP
jgi:hypothetical protein